MVQKGACAEMAVCGVMQMRYLHSSVAETSSHGLSGDLKVRIGRPRDHAETSDRPALPAPGAGCQDTPS
jgi:hypothetical protein